VGNNTGSGFAQIQFNPEIDVTDEKNSLAIVGAFQDKEYFKHYNNSSDYSGGLDYKGTPSALIQTHLGINYDSAIIGQGINGLINSSGPVLSGADLALFGTQQRVQTSRANGDVKFGLSAKDTLIFSSYYLVTRYEKSFAVNDYDGYGGSAGYSRQISENLQLGVQGTASRYIYRFVSGADTTVYSPQVTFSNALSAYWKIQGALGASFINRGVNGSSTSVSGNANLCRTTERSNFCLTFLRAVLPTGANGTQNEIQGGMSYSYKISSRDTITSQINYTSNSGISLGVVPKTAFLNGDLIYRHPLTEKIDMTLQARYSHIVENTAGRSADYGGQFGISVKVGSLHGR
jgi:hypothetical protein